MSMECDHTSAEGNGSNLIDAISHGQQTVRRRKKIHAM